jgi:hypothetical protein
LAASRFRFGVKAATSRRLNGRATELSWRISTAAFAARRHSSGLTFGPDALQMAVTREQVKSAPNIELQGDELSRADESALYHHYELNYTPPETESGRRLARR